MKLAFFLDDEAWFWIFNDETLQWECWYETEHTPAQRIHQLDRFVTTAVTEMIAEMSLAAQNDVASEAVRVALTSKS